MVHHLLHTLDHLEEEEITLLLFQRSLNVFRRDVLLEHGIERETCYISTGCHRHQDPEASRHSKLIEGQVSHIEHFVGEELQV